MNIRHLSIFKTVCEEMSITKAANRLYMTQPAVSHVIAELEREAGTPLFDRRSQRIFINERGRVLLQKAVRILELYEELNRELPGLERNAALRVGSSITIAGFWLPSFVRKFEKICPGTPLIVEVDSALHTVSRLERGEIDIALVEGAFYLEPFEHVPFSSYDIVPICAPEYLKEICKDCGQEMSLEAFASIHLLLREKGSAVRDVLEGAFLQREIKVKPRWTSVNSQAIIKAAKAGLGAAVLPDILVRQEIGEGSLVRLRVEDLKLVNHNYIAFHKSGCMTSSMKIFIDIAAGENVHRPD